MKSLLLSAALACSALISCQKVVPVTSQDKPLPASAPLVYFLLGNDIVGANLTGFPIVNLRTGADWKTASGTIALSVTSEGALQALGVYNLSFQGNSATIFASNYSISVEPMWPGEPIGTYKLTCIPNGNSAGYTFYAVAKVGVPINGEYSISIDDGAIDPE